MLSFVNGSPFAFAPDCVNGLLLRPFHPEGNLAVDAKSGHLAVFYMGLDLFYIYRINVADGFRHFGYRVVHGIFNAFVGGGDDFDHFYKFHIAVFGGEKCFEK